MLSMLCEKLDSDSIDLLILYNGSVVSEKNNNNNKKQKEGI